MSLMTSISPPSRFSFAGKQMVRLVSNRSVGLPVFNSDSPTTLAAAACRKISRVVIRSALTAETPDDDDDDDDDDVSTPHPIVVSTPQLIVLPLPADLFPGTGLTVTVKDAELLALLEECHKKRVPVAAFVRKVKLLGNMRGKDLIDNLYELGTLAQIQHVEGDRVDLTGGRTLIRITEMVSENPLIVKVDILGDLEEEIDEKITLAAMFDEKKMIPAHIFQVIEQERKKLHRLEVSSSEYNVTDTYLDWLRALPWGKYSDEIFDIVRAQKILDEDHYGLSDVKERILEFIAVGNLKGDIQGKIICLSGPPGVGKTTLGRSIARALNRKFYQFSIGGLKDVAEIKGHHRTYVGAMPGKMVQCLKSVGTFNLLVLIDEIDKLGRGCTGDLVSAILELLDPAQNANFLDHYLSVPIDLSKVLFVCTACVVESIPEPLLDRMELIPIAGYIADEKTYIARDYLEKDARESCNVKEEQAELTDGALLALIENYCREAGVRNLQKHIKKIYRKIALKLVRADASKLSDLVGNSVEKVSVDESNLPEFVGYPGVHVERIYKETPVGVAMALAWTATGGSTLYIESTQIRHEEKRRELFITGQLGGVMKESAKIAHTVAREVLFQKEPMNLFFANTQVHLHVLAGIIPKDGHTTGCTMVTSLLSLAMKKPVKPNLAMTGEVTLTGKILSINGVKEKTIAAKRSGVKTIIFPSYNRSHFEELAPNVKEGLDVHFVEYYNQIFALAFD